LGRKYNPSGTRQLGAKALHHHHHMPSRRSRRDINTTIQHLQTKMKKRDLVQVSENLADMLHRIVAAVLTAMPVKDPEKTLLPIYHKPVLIRFVCLPNKPLGGVSG